MSELKVNKISPRSGTDVTLGDSGDTFTVPSGATLDASNATLTLPDDSVTAAKLDSTAVDNTNTNSTVITGQTAETSIDGADSILIYDDSATALRKMTRTNFVAGIGGTNTPAFLAHVSGSAFSLPNSTQTKVIFNSEKYDTASAYDTSTALFTVPSGEGGRYFLCGQLFMGGASASRFIMIMRLNSSSNLIYMDGEKTAPCTVFASTVRTLSAGDTVHIEASQNSGSAQNLDYSPTAEVNYFYGYKLIE